MHPLARLQVAPLSRCPPATLPPLYSPTAARCPVVMRSLGRRANKLIDLCHEPCRQSVLIFSCSRGAVFAFSFFIFSWLLLIMGVQHRPPCPPVSPLHSLNCSQLLAILIYLCMRRSSSEVSARLLSSSRRQSLPCSFLCLCLSLFLSLSLPALPLHLRLRLRLVLCCAVCRVCVVLKRTNVCIN